MRFPLAVSLGNRAGDLDKDAKIVNAFVEDGGDAATGGRKRAVKRPGLDSAYTVATGTGQGLLTWTIPGPLGPTQILVAITDDTLNTSPTKIPKALVFTVQPS